MYRKIVAAAALLLLLTGCNKEPVSGYETDMAAEDRMETLPETTSAEISAAAPDEEEDSAILPEKISLTDHSAFDEAEPLQYSVDTPCAYEPGSGIAAEQAALDAVNASQYLEIINDEARDMLECNDGVYTCREGKRTFLTDTYIRYMGGDYKAQPQLLQAYKAAFDGADMEYIFTYTVPLHKDFLEWTGTNEFIIPVYVNSDNKAYILEMAARQTVMPPELLHYSDNVVHAVFNWGHSSGTSGSAIYSFSCGEPTLEFAGGGLSFEPSGTVLFNDISGFLGHGNLMFRDGIRNCYCGVSGVPVSDELAELLKGSAGVPDFDDVRDELCIYGGKYISFGENTIKFENGEFCESEYGDVFQTNNEYCRYWVNAELN